MIKEHTLKNFKMFVVTTIYTNDDLNLEEEVKTN